MREERGGERDLKFGEALRGVATRGGSSSGGRGESGGRRP